jgi:hypothetical protein
MADNIILMITDSISIIMKMELMFQGDKTKVFALINPTLRVMMMTNAGSREMV